VALRAASCPRTRKRITEFIRPCIRSGQIACRKLTCVMLYATPAKPATTPNATRNGSGYDFGASGRKRLEVENSTAVQRIVGPTPSRFEIRLVVNAASNGPTLPSEKARPSAPG
jgi:hypothetical protein